MKKVYIVALFIVAILFSFLSRPHSLGIKLQQNARNYVEFLFNGETSEAKQFMTESFSSEFSEEFLHTLSGLPAPETFTYDGSDSRGYRMVGCAGESGSRVIWFSTDGEAKVTADTAIDNILGSAVMLCTEEARANPHGNCPVSGLPYQYDEVEGLVVCASGHLGEGLVLNSNECEIQREAVAQELVLYLEAGYDYPENLEDMFVLSDGVYGRRGGYSCPDNGYKYYEIQNGEIYCPFHQNQLQEETPQE